MSSTIYKSSRRKLKHSNFFSALPDFGGLTFLYMITPTSSFIASFSDMLRFAKKLLGSPTTAAVEINQGDLPCDFFVLEGERWVSLSDAKCLISFEDRPKSSSSMTISCDAESVSETFALDSISNLTRFLGEDGDPCFQWIVKKGKGGDSMEEFGIRFDSEAQADRFASDLTARAQQTATVVAEFASGLNLIEKVSDDTWQTLEEEVVVTLSKGKKGDHFFTVQKGDHILFSAPVTNSLQFEFEYPVMAFLGLTPLSEDIRVLGIQCDDESAFTSLQESIVSASQEGGVSKRKPGRKAPIIESSDDDSSDVEMWEDSNEGLAVTTRRARRKADATDDLFNKHLQVGKKIKSRAIVFSNDQKNSGFQVFDTSSSAAGGLKSTSGFNKIALNPSHVMIHEGDSKCLLLDPSLGRDKIFELDLERGKVVNEWTPGMGASVNAILPIASGAQATGEKTFLGLNDRSIFVMDPRVNPSEISGNRVKAFNYATNVKLNAAATDAQSRMVVSNKAGQLRLFDGETNRDGDLKRAKTLLAGFGDAITHVELTADGQWILATCATYLVLVKTESADGVSGFAKSIGASADPITLALDYSDIVKNKLGSIQFTPARFDEKRGLIVSSTGSMAVMWDFGKIKKNGKISYSLKFMNNFILDTSVADTSVVAMYEHRLDIAKVRSSTSRGT